MVLNDHADHVRGWTEAAREGKGSVCPSPGYSQPSPVWGPVAGDGTPVGAKPSGLIVVKRQSRRRLPWGAWGGTFCRGGDGRAGRLKDEGNGSKGTSRTRNRCTAWKVPGPRARGPPGRAGFRGCFCPHVGAEPQLPCYDMKETRLPGSYFEDEMSLGVTSSASGLVAHCKGPPVPQDTLSRIVFQRTRGGRGSPRM